MERAADIRVATYNVHSFVGRDGKRAPERVFQVIREIDPAIIALQEVPCHAEELEDFAASFDVHSYLAPAAEGRAGFGNALLVRGAARAEVVRLHDLTVAPNEPRIALDVIARVEGTRPIRVVATHLGLQRKERRTQAARLAEICAAHAEPGDATVLLGDMNAWERGASSIGPLLSYFHPPLRLRTFPSNLPLLALDAIFVSPALTLGALEVHRSAAARVASDHLPVVSVVKGSVSAPGVAGADDGGHEEHR